MSPCSKHVPHVDMLVIWSGGFGLGHGLRFHPEHTHFTILLWLYSLDERPGGSTGREARMECRLSTCVCVQLGVHVSNARAQQKTHTQFSTVLIEGEVAFPRKYISWIYLFNINIRHKIDAHVWCEVKRGECLPPAPFLLPAHAPRPPSGFPLWVHRNLFNGI